MTDVRKMIGDALRVRRVKLERPGYDCPAYEFVDRRGIVQGDAIKTGTHLDNYPWQWEIEFAVEPRTARDGQPLHDKQGESADTLRACKEAVNYAWSRRVIDTQGQPVAYDTASAQQAYADARAAFKARAAK